MARLFCVDVVKNKAYECECIDLDDYYKYLQCECFDIANRSVAGERFDIFVDDVGLFAEHPIISAFSSEDELGAREPQLVGNLIFAKHNCEGETIGLSDESIEHIKKHMRVCMQNGNVHIAVVDVDY